jgi:hypothetical protein
MNNINTESKNTSRFHRLLGVARAPKTVFNAIDSKPSEPVQMFDVPTVPTYASLYFN